MRKSAKSSSTAEREASESEALAADPAFQKTFRHVRRLAFFSLLLMFGGILFVGGVLYKRVNNSPPAEAEKAPWEVTETLPEGARMISVGLANGLIVMTFEHQGAWITTVRAAHNGVLEGTWRLQPQAGAAQN